MPKLLTVPQLVALLHKALLPELRQNGTLNEGQTLSIQAVVLEGSIQKRRVFLDAGNAKTFRRAGNFYETRELAPEEIEAIASITWQQPWQKGIADYIIGNQNSPASEDEITDAALEAGLQWRRRGPQVSGLISRLNTRLKNIGLPTRLLCVEQGKWDEKEREHALATYRFFMKVDKVHE
jgi:hypothetical protein